jgi:hypothetical protein
MKRLLLICALALLAYACEDTPPPPPGGNDTVTGTILGPQSVSVVSGQISSTALTALAVKDQTGTQDDFAKYVELSPTANQSEAIFTLKNNSFPLIDVNLTLVVNYKGPLKTTDQWEFQVFRPKTSTWEKVGDNTLAKDWIWTLFRFNVGLYSNTFNDAGIALVKVKSLTGLDSVNLDLLAFNYLGALPTPVPTATPTPSPTPTPDPTPTPEPGAWWKPTIGTRWDIQYVGTISVKPDIMIYNIDMFEAEVSFIQSLHALGKKVICYFSAGSFEDWRPDVASFPASVLGSNMDGWPGEKWLDISKVETLRPIMAARIQMAKDKGCDGVDPDNINGYENPTGFTLNYQHQISYNRMLAQEAHNRGLAIGLKNDLNQINDLVGNFDFAVNESCFDYNECGLLTPFITANKPVFGIQYNGNVTTFCPKAKTLKMDFIKKKWDLDAWIDPCWNH